MRTLDRSRPGIAAQAVGIAQGALEVAAAYANERKQFGKPIAEFQMIAAMLADMDAAHRGRPPAPLQGLHRDRIGRRRCRALVGHV